MASGGVRFPEFARRDISKIAGGHVGWVRRIFWVVRQDQKNSICCRYAGNREEKRNLVGVDTGILKVGGGVGISTSAVFSRQIQVGGTK
jgi:hypothetical protein